MMKKIALVAIIVVAIALPITLYQTQTVQNLTQQAATPDETLILTPELPTTAEVPGSADEIRTLNTQINTLLSPVIEEREDFTLTDAMNTLLLTRKEKMYYLARTNPADFVTVLLPETSRLYLPTNLIEDVEFAVQGNLHFDTTDQTWYVQNPFDNTKTLLYFYPSVPDTLHDEMKVIVTGIRLDNRLVIDTNRSDTIELVEEFMQGH